MPEADWPSVGWTPVNATGPVTITFTHPGATVTASGTTYTTMGNTSTWSAPVYAPTPTFWSTEPIQEVTEEEREAQRLALLEMQQRERRDHEERSRRRRERAAEERRQFEAASQRAEELLREHLDEEQRAEFDAHGHFHVSVEDRRYRITRRRQGNVFCDYDYYHDGRLRHRCYCIHPREDLPPGDQMLAQKFMLETDEEEFLRIANIFSEGVVAA